MAVLKELPEAAQDRYLGFFRKKITLLNTLGEKAMAPEFLRMQLTRLDRLETHFIQLLAFQHQGLGSTEGLSETDLDAQIARLRAEMTDAPERVRKLHEKRLALNQKRRTQLRALSEEKAATQVQLATIEDTVAFLQEQAILLTRPEEIGRLIASAVDEAEVYYTAHEEVRQLFNPPTEPDWNADSAAEINPIPNR
jgi:hypothetical protein